MDSGVGDLGVGDSSGIPPVLPMCHVTNPGGINNLSTCGINNLSTCGINNLSTGGINNLSTGGINNLSTGGIVKTTLTCPPPVLTPRAIFTDRALTRLSAHGPPM